MRNTSTMKVSTDKAEFQTYLLGITGGIGSGKSYVCRLFSKHGIPVYDTDKKAKYIIGSNEELQRKIVEFIPGAFSNGIYDTKHVAHIIFSDEEKRLRLTDLVGSYLKEDFKNFIVANADSKALCVESAILQSKWLNDIIDGVLEVVADEELRISRIIKRDGRTREQALDIMKTQKPYPSPTFVLQNDNDDVEQKVLSILKTIQNHYTTSKPKPYTCL